MLYQAGASRGDVNHRRHVRSSLAGPSGGEFCHLSSTSCGRTSLRCVGARSTKLVPMPVASRLCLQEEYLAPRIVRVTLLNSEDWNARGGQVPARGCWAAVRRWSHRRAGSNLGEEVTCVEPWRDGRFLVLARLRSMCIGECEPSPLHNAIDVVRFTAPTLFFFLRRLVMHSVDRTTPASLPMDQHDPDKLDLTGLKCPRWPALRRARRRGRSIPASGFRYTCNRPLFVIDIPNLSRNG